MTLTPIPQADAVEMLERNEAKLAFMYCDTCAPPVVTVGVGHALRSVEDAKALPFFWSSVSRTGRPASPAEIEAEFHRTLALHINYLKPRLAQMELHDSAISTLLAADIAIHERIVKNEVPEYVSLPRPVQLALLDIAFNCGSLAHFPRLKSAVLSGNWLVASKEAFRPKVSASRNEFVREAFLGMLSSVASD